ncbi:GGDEF domain-containing protein [Rhodococcus sp. BP-332]|uniref:GGDEF domain-containing protein n=1 Tax=Rhodococcus sp. BP-332 TaxID=2739447 RepID=UPI001C9A7DDB|nr:GGDEF domain-containing protein [Rhodococcus sp. BP-332]MBY6678754.1 GGDEF domain-containing protein [Rhodococcus sp. BP-332]
MTDVVRRRIAVLIPSFAVPGILTMFSAAGPAAGAPRIAAIAVLLSTLPVAAIVATARKSFTWWRRARTQRAVALAFTVYADVGTSIFLLLCSSHALGLAGCALFAVISSYVAFFGGRATVVVHLVLTTVVIGWMTALVLREQPIGAMATIAAATSIWLAVNATMSIVSTTSMSLHRHLERQIDSARTDPLTGLLNLRGLEVQAKRQLRGRSQVGFLLVDLDHFKWVNDHHGHIAGDGVLALAAQRLRDHLGDRAVVARRGGEEFLVVLDAQSTGLHALAESIRVALSDPADLIPVTVSIGVSCLDTTRMTAAPIASTINHGMHLADIAMYRAKAAGRNTVVVYADS